MLETVIEEEHLGLEFFGRCLRQRHTVGALKVRNVGQVFFEHHGFVVAAAVTAVAAAEDHGPQVEAVAQKFGEVLNARCLTGAAECEITDADHRHGGAEGFLPAVVVKEIAGLSPDTIREA